MTVTQALSMEQVWNLYMAESMTFEMVANLDFDNFVDIVFCDFNVVPMERARSIAIMCKGYAVRKWLEEIESDIEAEKIIDEAELKFEKQDRDVDELMALEQEYMDADELYCLAHPGALM